MDVDRRVDALTDPFNFDEENPEEAGALESSLWEMDSLKNHFHHGVATLAQIFSEAMNKPNYQLEDFLDHTYSTVYLCYERSVLIKI